MLSSSLYTMLNLTKTTSPNKLFDYDCITLYIHICKMSIELPDFYFYFYIFVNIVFLYCIVNIENNLK